MRLGLVARATTTGLGYQSLNAYRGLKPASTLVVTGVQEKLRENVEWYPDGYKIDIKDLEVPYNRTLRLFMNEVDVVFAAETLYARSVYELAKAKGVRTVIQANPELTRDPGNHGWLGDPSEYVWPTTWMLERLGGRVLPVPVDSTLTSIAADPQSEPFTIVHVAGRRAIGDRNGSEIFTRALEVVKSPVRVRYCVQDKFEPMLNRIPPNVEVEVMRPEHRDVMYDNAHLLVMPRKYGGLCLPVLEAMESGLAVMMTDCKPNRDWPILPITCSRGRLQRVPRGAVETWTANARAIGYEIDRYNHDREALAAQMKRSVVWAQENTWSALGPLYDEVLTP